MNGSSRPLPEPWDSDRWIRTPKNVTCPGPLEGGWFSKCAMGTLLLAQRKLITFSTQLNQWNGFTGQDDVVNTLATESLPIRRHRG